MKECIYCKSTELELDVPITARAKGVNPFNLTPTVGPYYNKGKNKDNFLGITVHVYGIEPMFAEICKQCGGVKLYIKDTHKNWERKLQ